MGGMWRSRVPKPKHRSNLLWFLHSIWRRDRTKVAQGSVSQTHGDIGHRNQQDGRPLSLNCDGQEEEEEDMNSFPGYVCVHQPNDLH